MTPVADEVAEFAYGMGWAAARRMPEKAAYAMFERIADASWARRGKQVRRLESNLRRVLGPEATGAGLRQTSKIGMRTYLRYWADAFRMADWSSDRVLTSMVPHDDYRLAEALAAGNGVVVALPHMGNWDHTGAWACLRHAQVTTVVERLKPEGLYDKFTNLRRAMGVEVLPLTGGDPAFPILLKRVRAGGLVALLSDRDLTEHGLPVQFFGSEARFPAGPAALAVQTGAVLLPAAMWLEDDRNHVKFLAPITPAVAGSKKARIAAMTQEIAHSFELIIAEHPGDWHMMQRLWTDDLEPWTQ